MSIEQALTILENEASSAKEKETALDFLAKQFASRQAEAILQVLVAQLAYPDDDVQFHALVALENFYICEGAPLAIQPLIEYLLDKEKIRDIECRVEAAYVLELYAKAQVVTSELAIEPLLQTIYATNAQLREFSLDALCQFAGSRFAPYIVQSLISGLDAGGLQTEAVYSLICFAGVPGIEAAIAPLIKLANAPDTLTRLFAIEGLAELGSLEIIPVLEAHLKDTQKEYIRDFRTGEISLVEVSELAQYAIERISDRARLGT